MAKKTADHEYVASVWFERGEGYVSLSTPKGRELFRLRNEEIGEAIEDGYLEQPKLSGWSSRAMNSEEDWQSCLVQYAKEMGLIK